MPALPFVTGVARIEMRHTFGTDANVINRFYSKFTGTADEPSLNTWAAAVTTAWVTNLAPFIVIGNELNEVLITDLSSAIGASGSDITNSAGSAGGTAVPANVAMVVQYQINRRYRGGRPRQYIGAQSIDALLDEDHWTPAHINSFEAAYTLFMTAACKSTYGTVTSTGNVNVSYYKDHTWEQDQHGNWHKIPTLRPSPQLDVVNGYTVNPVVGTQRRRARA